MKQRSECGERIIPTTLMISIGVASVVIVGAPMLWKPHRIFREYKMLSVCQLARRPALAVTNQFRVP